MSPVAPALDRLSDQIAALSEQLGRRVEIARLQVTDRVGHLDLAPPGLRSPNGACRLVRAADNWIAVNLARDDDKDLIPAWLGCEFGTEPWPAVRAFAGARTAADLVAGATLLGLPVAAVGEVHCERLEPPLVRMGSGAAVGRNGPLRVVDLSALWAGPLCGRVLAEMGAAVTKVESLQRPDPTRTSTPGFFARLNGGKADVRLNLSSADGRARLRDAVLQADVLITGARPRGAASLGLIPEELFMANPGLVWVAVTGYGWTGEGASRVAFGDDAAAAGGLLRWTPRGAPRFLGDALADPVTGLAAAVGALQGVIAGGGVLVDVALARSAAAAAVCRLRAAA